MKLQKQTEIINAIYKVMDIDKTSQKLYHDNMANFEIEYAIKVLNKKRKIKLALYYITSCKICQPKKG